MHDSSKRTGVGASNDGIWFSFRNLASRNLLTGIDFLTRDAMGLGDVKTPRWPHYNIVKTDGGCRFELACAGFKKDELSIKIAENNILVIEGRHLASDDGGPEYVYHGISNKPFKALFDISGSEVDGISFVDGILAITIAKKESEEITLEIH